tara:strand:+ start:2016 stop:2573 length:558 start_codon:yes stop_codon:yes gene_type:complete
MPFNNIPGTGMGNMGGLLGNFSDNWEEMQRANQLKRAQEFQNRLSEANDSRRSSFSGMYESQRPGLINLQRGNYAPMGGGFHPGEFHPGVRAEARDFSAVRGMQQPGLLNMQRGGYSNMGGLDSYLEGDLKMQDSSRNRSPGGLIPPSPQPQMPQRMGGSPDFEDLLNQLNMYGGKGMYDSGIMR